MDAGDNGHGIIKLTIGPMFASKSTALIAEIRKNLIARKKCAIITFSGDDRYSNDAVITSHDGHKLSMPAAFKVTKLEDCHKDIVDGGIQVIGIDEGQFFSDVAEYADKWASMGINVFVSALDGDWQRKPFPNIIDLIPRSEEVVKLKAICMKCYNDNASFSFRIVKSNKTIVVGGTDKYLPLCRQCYNASASHDDAPVANDNISSQNNT